MIIPPHLQINESDPIFAAKPSKSHPRSSCDVHGFGGFVFEFTSWKDSGRVVQVFLSFIETSWKLHCGFLGQDPFPTGCNICISYTYLIKNII